MSLTSPTSDVSDFLDDRAVPWVHYVPATFDTLRDRVAWIMDDANEEAQVRMIVEAHKLVESITWEREAERLGDALNEAACGTKRKEETKKMKERTKRKEETKKMKERTKMKEDEENEGEDEEEGGDEDESEDEEDGGDEEGVAVFEEGVAVFEEERNEFAIGGGERVARRLTASSTSGSPSDGAFARRPRGRARRSAYPS